MRAPLALLVAVFIVLSAAEVRAERFVVAPYLQAVESSSASVFWETEGTRAGRLWWGEDAPRSEATELVHTPTASGHVLHAATLRGLRPDTRYVYRVDLGRSPGPELAFVTRPADGAARTVRFIAMSDMQHDRKRPDQLRQIVEDGVIPVLRALSPGPLERAAALVLAPGDLLAHGRDYEEWPSVLFGPMRALLGRVPMLPVLGNHDDDSPFYFRYFALPPGQGERAFVRDEGNVRIIGLDTNTGQRTPEQLAFLARTLDDACAAPAIDFVFAEHHHPERSELWPSGDTPYAGEIARRLEAFAERCQKPTFALFGHTHAYARGHSPLARHTWLSVASAGGDLDYAGEYAAHDYPEYVVSQDEYGFVLLDVESGPAARVRVRRFSRGNALVARDNELRDDFTVRRNAAAPPTPALAIAAGEPLSPGCPELALAHAAVPDDEPVLATELQLSGPDCDFRAPLRDFVLPRFDLFAGADGRRMVVPGLLPLGALPPGARYCARARLRNQSLVYGPWSPPIAFSTRSEPAQACTRAALCAPARPRLNLLVNPGAEEGVVGYAGRLESLGGGACRSVAPVSGARLFAVGGVCARGRDRAVAVQRVGLARFSPLVDRGGARLAFGGMLRSDDGRDLPALFVRLRDGHGALLAESAALSQSAPRWERVEAAIEVPQGTRYAELVLQGRRRYGRDNDSYFDDLFVTLAGEHDATCTPP